MLFSPSELQQRQQRQPENRKQLQRRNRSQRRLAVCRQAKCQRSWQSKTHHNSCCSLWLLPQARGEEKLFCVLNINIISIPCCLEIHHRAWFHIIKTPESRKIAETSVCWLFEVSNKCAQRKAIKFVCNFSCVRNRKAYEDQALDTDLIQMELPKNNGVKDIVVNVTNQNWPGKCVSSLWIICCSLNWREIEKPCTLLFSGLSTNNIQTNNCSKCF